MAEKAKTKANKKELKTFIVQGKLLLKDSEQAFSKELMAFNENNAAERTMTLFGSKNRIKRRNIQITEIKLLNGEKKKNE